LRISPPRAEPDLHELRFLGGEQRFDDLPLGLVHVFGRQQLAVMLDVEFGDGFVDRRAPRPRHEFQPEHPAHVL